MTSFVHSKRSLPASAVASSSNKRRKRTTASAIEADDWAKVEGLFENPENELNENEHIGPNDYSDQYYTSTYAPCGPGCNLMQVCDQIPEPTESHGSSSSMSACSDLTADEFQEPCPEPTPSWSQEDLLRRTVLHGRELPSEPMLLLLTSYPFRVSFASKTFTIITGWSPGDVFGRPLQDLFSFDDKRTPFNNPTIVNCPVPLGGLEGVLCGIQDVKICCEGGKIVTGKIRIHPVYDEVPSSLPLLKDNKMLVAYSASFEMMAPCRNT